MWPFNLGEQTVPRRWADMSLELKGMFLYHGSVMALFALPMFGRLLDPLEYVFVAATVALAVAIVSAFRRARLDWHWRGAGLKEVLSVVILTLLFGFFALSVNGKFPPPAGLMPWYLGVAGIYAFSVLRILHIVHFAEADFRSECGDAVPAKSQARPHEAGWKRVVRAMFSVFFLAVWLEGVSFFYFYTRAVEHGTSEPTGAQSWSIDEHGQHHYVTKEEYDRVELLKTLMIVGAPTAIATAAFLQFVLGINMGWRTRGDKER